MEYSIIHFNLLINQRSKFMKKLLSVLAGVMLSVNFAFATRYVTQSYPMPDYAYNPSVYNHNYQNINTNKLSQMEHSVFGRTYDGQSYENRLNRLERSVFNRTYSNLPFEERLDNLFVNYNNNYNNNYSYPVNSKKGLINTISTMLMGSPTGLSPQINPYWGSNPSAPNGRQYDYYGRDGWRHQNNNIGSGVGIKILD